MDISVYFLQWLSKKLYLANLGLYATIIAIMVLPPLLTKTLGVSLFWASLIVFFIVSFARAVYESLVIYDVSVKNLSPTKMLLLVTITASTMSLVSHFLKPTLGYFSIPVSIFIAMGIVGKLKSILWPAPDRPGFLHELPEKLALSKISMYGFYAILVGISYSACTKYSINFYYAFVTAFFLAMLFEEFYTLNKVYKQNMGSRVVFSTIIGLLAVVFLIDMMLCESYFMTKIYRDSIDGSRMVLPVIIWSLICALASGAVIWVMVTGSGFSYQVATITAVVLVKLLQPLGSRLFIGA